MYNTPIVFLKPLILRVQRARKIKGFRKTQQFSVWASKRRVRARRARTLRFEARKRPAKGGLFSGWLPKWELL